MKKVSIKRLLILVGIYSIVANFAHPLTPTFIKNLGLHDYMFGVAFASMSLTNFLFSPFFGKISKALGCVKVFGFCFIGYGVAQLMFGSSTTELGIILARALAGFFLSGITVNQLLYIMENSEATQRSQYLANCVSVNLVISPFGFLIGGFLGDISIPMTFYIQAGGLVLIGILYWLVLEDKPREEALDVKLLLHDSNPFAAILNSRELLTAMVVVFLGVAVLTSFASTCYEQCFNYFIKDQYNFPASYNGIVKAVVGFISLFANMTITKWLLHKTDIKKSIIYVLSICLAMMVAVVIVNDIVPFIIINVVLFGFNAVYQPLLQSILPEFKAKNDGILVGLYNSVRSLGMVFGSLVAGMIYGIGPKLSFVTASVVLGLAIVCAMVNYRQWQAKKETV